MGVATTISKMLASGVKKDYAKPAAKLKASTVPKSTKAAVKTQPGGNISKLKAQLIKAQQEFSSLVKGDPQMVRDNLKAKVDRITQAIAKAKKKATPIRKTTKNREVRPKRVGPYELREKTPKPTTSQKDLPAFLRRQAD